MAYITGTGSLVVEEINISHTDGFRSKEITGTGALEVEESTTYGDGLEYVDGEIASYITHLETEPVEMSGEGKADNLARMPRACAPIKANFHVCTTKIKARIKLP